MRYRDVSNDWYQEISGLCCESKDEFFRLFDLITNDYELMMREEEDIFHQIYGSANEIVKYKTFFERVTN